MVLNGFDPNMTVGVVAGVAIVIVNVILFIWAIARWVAGSNSQVTRGKITSLAEIPSTSHPAGLPYPGPPPLPGQEQFPAPPPLPGQEPRKWSGDVATLPAFKDFKPSGSMPPVSVIPAVLIGFLVYSGLLNVWINFFGQANPDFAQFIVYGCPFALGILLHQFRKSRRAERWKIEQFTNERKRLLEYPNEIAEEVASAEHALGNYEARVGSASYYLDKGAPAMFFEAVERAERTGTAAYGVETAQSKFKTYLENQHAFGLEEFHFPEPGDNFYVKRGELLSMLSDLKTRAETMPHFVMVRLQMEANQRTTKFQKGMLEMQAYGLEQAEAAAEAAREHAEHARLAREKAAEHAEREQKINEEVAANTEKMRDAIHDIHRETVPRSFWNKYKE